MATITEDYVSFETAKLLKEKGFDELCDTKYYGDDCSGPSYIRECLEDGGMVSPMSNSDLDCGSDYDDISAPTLLMAMKWLRKEHNIMVSPYALSLGYYFEIFDLTNRDITGCKPLYKVGIPNKEDVLSTYEQACETAIKYCIENLI